MFKNFQFLKNLLRAELKGFTLIEMLIATGIFGIIMLLASTLVISITRANYKTRIQRQVNDEVRNIIETITREAKLSFGREDEDTIKVEEGGDKLVLTESPELTKSFQLVDAGDGNKSIEVQSTEFTAVLSDRPKRDIVLVVDASGSMNTKVQRKPRYEWVKIAIEEFLDSDSLDLAYDQVGLVSFSGAGSWVNMGNNYWKADATSTIHSGLTNNFDSIKDKFGEITFINGTGTGLGMENASNELLNNGRSDAQKFQILLTDGCANLPLILNDIDGNLLIETDDGCCGEGPDIFYSRKADVPFETENLIEDQIDEQIEMAKNNNISIYTVGFGPKWNTNYLWDKPCCRLVAGDCLDTIYLDNIAQQTGGEYFEASKPKKLVGYFKVIAEKMFMPTETLYTSLITTSEVNVKDLKFDLYGDKTQPFLNIELTVESKGYDSNPDWRRASVTYKTTISSRDYITE